MEISAFTTVLSSNIFFELFLSAFFFYFENFSSLIRRGLPFVYDSKCLYYHRGRARDLRSSTNWWSLCSGQQVLLGGKRLIIFTVQNLLNMFLSGLSSIQKEKYVERDDMVYEERIDRLVY